MVLEANDSSASVRQARAGLEQSEQAKAQVGEAQATLDDARITAPFAGRVIERRLDPGSLASPGMPLLIVAGEISSNDGNGQELARAAS